MPILLVEDHAELGSLIVEGLKRSGISTDPVGNAGDADRALATTRYAAVVLDLGLPDEDGLSWLRGVRGRGDSTPVLVLTARDGISDCSATVQVHTVRGVGYMLAEAKAG